MKKRTLTNFQPRIGQIICVFNKYGWRMATVEKIEESLIYGYFRVTVIV